jgi:hypothetical protein
MRRMCIGLWRIISSRLVMGRRWVLERRLIVRNSLIATKVLNKNPCTISAGWAVTTSIYLSIKKSSFIIITIIHPQSQGKSQSNPPESNKEATFSTIGAVTKTITAPRL